MQFIVQWTVFQMEGVSGGIQKLHEKEPEWIDSPSETAAKAKATRMMKADDEVSKTLASKWYPEHFELKLESWEAPRKMHDNDNVLYCERRSRNEYKSQSPDKPSLQQWVVLRMYWKVEENSNA